jgi:gliding motility-associated-like protein
MTPSSTVPNPTVTPLVTTTYSVIVTSDKGCVDTGYVTVNVSTFGADAGPPVFFCEGSGGGQLMAGPVSGGVPGYYYEWWCAAPICALDSVFDNDPIANPDTTTMYYLQVTDTTGCKSQIDSVLVTVLPNPIVDAGPDIYICPFPAPGGNISATVTNAPGPYTYTWTPPTGLSSTTIANPYARPDTTTIYTCVVTSSNGCTSVPTTVDTLSSVTVHVNPQPIADAGPDRHLCLDDTLMMLGIGYGAGPTYTYEWSPYTPPTTLSANNIPNPLAFPDHTTDYTLVVWSNGCPSIADTATVNVHTNPTVDAGPDRDICALDSVLIDAMAGGDSTSSFYLFLWSPATGLSDPSAEDPLAAPDTTHLYYVQATSEYGCLSPLDSVLVTVKPTPIANAGDPLRICQGDSILIPASYYYAGTLPADPTAVWPAWTPAANISDTTLLQPVVWPTSTGFYHIALQHNTCITYDSVLITVIPSPVANLTADTTVICEGQSATLSVSGGVGGATFTWSPPFGLSDPSSANPIATPDTTTTYTVTASEGGCDGQNSITINVIPLPEMGYFSSQPNGCAPLTVSFLEDVKDALFHTWNFGDGSISNEPSPVHTYTQPGTYVVTLTASNLGDCQASISSIVVNVSEPGTAEFTADPSFPVQLTLPDTRVKFTDKSTNAVSHAWDFGDGQGSSEQNPEHSYRQPGEYVVSLTTHNVDGCISTVQHGPFIVLAPDIFIPNVFTPADDGTNDVFHVYYSGDQPFTITIVDRWGVALYQSTNKTEGWDGTDLKGVKVPEGVYFYALRIGDQEYAGEVTLLR